MVPKRKKPVRKVVKVKIQAQKQEQEKKAALQRKRDDQKALRKRLNSEKIDLEQTSKAEPPAPILPEKAEVRTPPTVHNLCRNKAKATPQKSHSKPQPTIRWTSNTPGEARAAARA